MSDGLNDDDFDSLAAEYVLGTLEADERTRANVLLDVDQAFRTRVRQWERRLGELHLMVEPVEPDRQIWERLRGKIGAGAGPSPPAQPVKPILPSELERQIEDDLAVAPAPAIDPVAELEKALEQVRAQETERSRASAPLPVPERPQSDSIKPEGQEDPAPAAGLDRLPEPTRTSAPETIPRGPPKSGLEAWPPVIDSALADDPQVPPAEARIPRESRTLDLTEEQVVPDDRGRRRLRRWRLVAMFMTLLVALLGGLISAWRYAPERLPPRLRPTAVLNLPDVPGVPPKKVAPPGSEFYE
jgi:hypothetical protein